MSKIARVKFIRDKEPNIKALTAKNKVLDGALYVATDTGTMWMGTSATSLIQIKDNINTNTTYTLTKSGSTITLKGSDGSAVNVTDSDTIYNNATASAAGLMSAADKSKLDSVATGANKTVVDASFVANSTNPVQSKVVKSALDGKVDKTGDTMTGRLTAPEVAATNYFVTPTIVGEGDKTKYYHRVDFGYAGHDYVDFHEYGGTWNFYQNQGSTEESKILVASIKPDGFHGNLKGQADSVLWSGVTDKPSFATVATSGSYNDLSNKPTIPTIPSSLKNPNALTISLNGTSQGAYDGSAVKNINITASSVGAAASSHTHTKAQITDFPTSMPASDVYSWAKQSSKPSYTISEVSGNLPASRINGTISASNLPSYVDDVLEYASFSKFPTTGESGKIYTALDTNKIYRWSGSTYVVISETIALGTTHATAGYGDESRAAYNHSTSTGNPHKTTKTDLGLGNVENKSSATIRGELTSANVTTALGYTPPRTDTNTHYTTRIVAGAANGTANAATTNGNTHINVTDDNTFRSGVVIKGTGATSVTSDASGNITVHSTDTDTWRPIQNNLTSTATDQSLSAAQGKALNDKFSSYVPTSRTVNGKALSANITLSAGDVGAAPASHSHSYLPLSGGTVSGNVHFASIGDKAKAAGITWDGSSDGASIYYETRGSDSGHLVLNMTDDSSVTVDIAAGGAVQSYFGYDGTFHGNVSGNASSASSVAWSNVSGKPSSMPASDVYAWAKASSKPSYSWSEISNRPTIPSVGNGTVTIKQNGATKGSFTLNQSGNATIELTDKDTNTWRPEEVIVSSSQPSASTCKLWIKI